MKFFKHLMTVMKHKHLVMKGCFRVGLYRQGITHDMSKFTPTEFLVGCKYFQGTRSPNNAEREIKGYSGAWLHHKGRNKHHFEYWIDYGTEGEKGLIGMRMPNRYVVEMFIDRVAASKTYRKDEFKWDDPLKYYEKGKGFHLMHPEVSNLLEELLIMLAKRGEDYTMNYIKQNVLKKGSRR